MCVYVCEDWKIFIKKIFFGITFQTEMMLTTTMKNFSADIFSETQSNLQ